MSQAQQGNAAMGHGAQQGQKTGTTGGIMGGIQQGMEKMMGTTGSTTGGTSTGMGQTGTMGGGGGTTTGQMTGNMGGQPGTMGSTMQQGQLPHQQQQLGGYTGSGMGGGTAMQELMNWDPFRDMNTFMGSSLMPFGGMGGMGMMPFSGTGSELTRALSQLQPMKLDIIENPNEYLVRADVPGYTRENVKIEVDDRTNMLHISTQRRDEREDQGERGGYTYHRIERTSGSNYRSLRLPENANAANVNATVINGVLNVSIPKREGVSSTGRRRVNIV